MVQCAKDLDKSQSTVSQRSKNVLDRAYVHPIRHVLHAFTYLHFFFIYAIFSLHTCHHLCDVTPPKRGGTTAQGGRESRRFTDRGNRGPCIPCRARSKGGQVKVVLATSAYNMQSGLVQESKEPRARVKGSIPDTVTLKRLYWHCQGLIGLSRTNGDFKGSGVKKSLMELSAVFLLDQAAF